MSLTQFWLLQSFEFAPADLLIHSQGGGFFAIDELWAAPGREYYCWLLQGFGYVDDAERHYGYLDNFICS